jgi:hypothetical protein
MAQQHDPGCDRHHTARQLCSVARADLAAGRLPLSIPAEPAILEAVRLTRSRSSQPIFRLAIAPDQAKRVAISQVLLFVFFVVAGARPLGFSLLAVEVAATIAAIQICVALVLLVILRNVREAFQVRPATHTPEEDLEIIRSMAFSPPPATDDNLDDAP